ncbi:hypothetical protein CAEBREN_01655 [Caenorhabditis brenneri]|uniref:Uncharacterized protein n=1 Tax=Caenorhabditis brenneri TaxID=135651 RepID=G0N526_CAEBE|nr:hypothetical protein CAEBREN_01655 [Caenorhabditis brenneri]
MDQILNAETLEEQPSPPTAAAIRSLPAQLVAAKDLPPKVPAQVPAPSTNNTNGTATSEDSWWGWLKRHLPCRSNRVDVTLSQAFAQDA